MKKTLLAVILLIFSIATYSQAAEIKLAWDAAPGVTGYRIYGATVSEPYNFSTPLYEGGSTSCTVIVPESKEYKFVARAYLIGESGVIYESGNSNQVQHAIVLWQNPNLRLQ